MENKSQIVRCLDGFRRLGVLWFIHDFYCRSPAVSALWRYDEVEGGPSRHRAN